MFLGFFFGSGFLINFYIPILDDLQRMLRKADGVAWLEVHSQSL